MQSGSFRVFQDCYGRFYASFVTRGRYQRQNHFKVHPIIHITVSGSHSLNRINVSVPFVWASYRARPFFSENIIFVWSCLGIPCCFSFRGRHGFLQPLHSHWSIPQILQCFCESHSSLCGLSNWYSAKEAGVWPSPSNTQFSNAVSAGRRLTFSDSSKFQGLNLGAVTIPAEALTVYGMF